MTTNKEYPLAKELNALAKKLNDMMPKGWYVWLDSYHKSNSSYQTINIKIFSDHEEARGKMSGLYSLSGHVISDDYLKLWLKGIVEKAAKDWDIPNPYEAMKPDLNQLPADWMKAIQAELPSRWHAWQRGDHFIVSCDDAPIKQSSLFSGTGVSTSSHSLKAIVQELAQKWGLPDPYEQQMPEKAGEESFDQFLSKREAQQIKLDKFQEGDEIEINSPGIPVFRAVVVDIKQRGYNEIFLKYRTNCGKFGMMSLDYYNDFSCGKLMTEYSSTIEKFIKKI